MPKPVGALLQCLLVSLITVCWLFSWRGGAQCSPPVSLLPELGSVIAAAWRAIAGPSLGKGEVAWDRCGGGASFLGHLSRRMGDLREARRPFS